MLDQVRRLAGIRKPTELPRPTVQTRGTVARAGFRIEKLLITPEEGIVLPALLFLPEKLTASRIVLYVHEQGKAVDAGPGGSIEQRVRAGDTILAVDLRGTGQTRSTSAGYYSPEYQDAYIAYLLGRSYVGIRAEDILVCARYAAERAASGQVRLVAIGNVGIPALHAAVLEPHLFQHVQLSRTLTSWSNVIHSRADRDLFAAMVHGALVHYDLPNLVALLDNKVTVGEPVNAMGVVVAHRIYTTDLTKDLAPHYCDE